MARHPFAFILALLALALFATPVYAATNANGFTLVNYGNNFNSGFNISIDVSNVCINNVTRATGETSTYAYVIVYNASSPAGIVAASSAFGGSDTATFSTCYPVTNGQVVGIAAGDIDDPGNTVHLYDNTGVSYPIVNSEITWLSGIQNSSGGWDAMSGIAFAIESIGLSSVAAPVCGNNITESPEECDGSAPEGYTCSESCTLVPIVIPPTPTPETDDSAALEFVIGMLAIAFLAGFLVSVIRPEQQKYALLIYAAIGIAIIVVLLTLL